MKKWFVTVAVIFVVSFTVGIFFRGKYAITNYSDASQLQDFNVRLLQKEDFNNELEGAAEEPLVIIEGENPYTNEMSTEYEVQHVSPEAHEDKKLSWIEKWVEELEQAEAVALVVSTGKIDNLAGTLQQEIEILEVCKGNLFQEKDIIYLLSINPVFFINDEKNYYVGTNYNNFMQEGQEYLVFFNSTPHKSGNLFYGASESGISYFCMDDYAEGFLDTEETFVKYSMLKNVEFFCNDSDIYRQLITVKGEMLARYIDHS